MRTDLAGYSTICKHKQKRHDSNYCLLNVTVRACLENADINFIQNIYNKRDT